VSQPKSQLDLDLVSIIRSELCNRCSTAGKFRSSGRADGTCAVVYELWQKFLRYDPADPTWPKPRSLCSFRWPRLDCCFMPLCI